MRLIFYFLILVNIVILLFNWDSFTNQNFVYSNKQEGETLKLANEQQIPARALAQQTEPQSQPNPVARFINGILDIMSSIGNILSGMFRDDQYPLPEAPPTPAPPPSPKPQLADYCINIGDYASLAAAEELSASLASYQISNSVETKPIQTGPSSFTIIALVRSDLGVAMELSELLLENGIRNSVKENKPLGYILVTNKYHSEAQANRILDKLKELGFSTRLTTEGKVTKNNYFIHLNRSAVPQLEKFPNLTELEGQVTFTEVPDC